MDAELEARFDQLAELIARSFEAQNERFDRRMDALEGRMAALEARLDAMDAKFEEKFLGVYERLDSERAAREQFERRVTDRLDAMGREIADLRQVVVRLEGRIEGLREGVAHLEVRVTELEKGTVRANARLDALSDDMRQRFRLVNERLSSLAA